MNDPTKSQLIFLSMQSAVGGVAFFAICFAVIAPFFYGFTLNTLELGLAISLFGGIAVAVLVFPVWLFVLVPLVLIVPPRSVLWDPAILTTCGCFCGPIICGLVNFFVHLGPQNLQSVVVIVGVCPALVGGATCYLAALLYKRLLNSNSMELELSNEL